VKYNKQTLVTADFCMSLWAHVFKMKACHFVQMLA